MEKKKKHTLRNGIIAAIAVGGVITQPIAQAHTPAGHATTYSTPRLVVGIMIDGLDQSAIEAYALHQGGARSGFGQLIREGVTISTVDYGLARGDAAAAMLVTGAMPAVNGVASSTVYDRERMRRLSCVHDEAFMGNFTAETYSPASIAVSTLGDEVMIASQGHSKVYAIAPTAPRALISAGHAASSGVWINDADGRWSTTTFYKDVPSAVSDHNYKQPLSQRLDTITWSGGPSGNAFRYSFPRKERDRYLMLKASPRVNVEVTDLACDYIAHLGKNHKNGATDMLTISYTVADYPYANPAFPAQSEQQAAYRALDAQIARVLEAVSTTVGLENTLIFVAGIPTEGYTRPVDAKYRIPTSEFSPRRARGLLNMYLMALHGNGEWVRGYDDCHFYLNLDLAKERGVTNSELRREAAEFLVRMSGVTRATTIDEILASPTARDFYNIATAGDVIIDVCPGWRLVDTDNPAIDGRTLAATPSVAPFYLLYAPLKATSITTPVSATAIAPTLSRAIRIRAPNAAATAPIALPHK